MAFRPRTDLASWRNCYPRQCSETGNIYFPFGGRVADVGSDPWHDHGFRMDRGGVRGGRTIIRQYGGLWKDSDSVLYVRQ